MVLSELSQFLSYAFLMLGTVSIYVLYTYLLTIMISITRDLKPAKNKHTNSSLLIFFLAGLIITSGVFPWKTQPVFPKGFTEVLVTVRPWMILGHQKKGKELWRACEHPKNTRGMIQKLYRVFICIYLLIGIIIKNNDFQLEWYTITLVV